MTTTATYLNNKNMCLLLRLALVFLLLSAVAALRGSEPEKRELQTDPVWSERAIAFKNYFSEFGISSKLVLEAPGTPQNKALLWFADQDPRQLAVPTGSVARNQGYKAMQRYLMAVSFFQLGGTKWRRRMGFLSGNSTCSWNQDENVTSVTARGNFNQRRRVGVLCNEGGQAVTLSLPDNNARSCIPAELECLTSLTSIDLSGNSNVSCPAKHLPPTLVHKVTTG